MANDLPTVCVEERIKAGDFTAELVTYRWRGGGYVQMRPSAFTIFMRFPEKDEDQSSDSTWRIGEHKPAKVGICNVSPSGVSVEVNVPPGLRRAVSCSCEDETFARIAGVSPTWFDVDFPTKFILHSERPRRMLGAIGRELKTPGFGREVAIEGYMLILLTEFGRVVRGGSQEASTGRLSAGQVKRLLEYIEENIDGNLGMMELANQVGISVRSLSRLFKASVGVTIRDYVAFARIQRVQTLLRETKLPLKTIAHRAGLKNGNYLSAAFSRQHGLSPSEYRAQWK